MERDALLQYLMDNLADDGAAIDDQELERIIDLAVTEYGRYVPNVIETTISTDVGTLRYDFPSGTIRVYSTLTTDGVDVPFRIWGRGVSFLRDPGTQVLTALISIPHELEEGVYPSIPDDHLEYIGDLAWARALDRIADEIIRRPKVTDALSSEDWQQSAKMIYQRAAMLRDKVTAELGDIYTSVG